MYHILINEEGSNHTGEPTTNDAMLVAQMTALLSNMLILNESNYSTWSRLIQMKIRIQGKLHHLTGVPHPPSAEEPEYPQ